MAAKKSFINCTIEHIASLCPHSSLTYLSDMSRGLIQARLALPLDITMNKRFSNLLLGFVCLSFITTVQASPKIEHLEYQPAVRKFIMCMRPNCP